MKVRIDTDGSKIITIHTGESEPTGAVLDGSAVVEEGDILINADTWAVKMFNGTSWTAKPEPVEE